MYDKLDKPWKNERRRLALDKLNTRPLVRLLRSYKPDFILCTHFLPAEIVAWLRAKERLASRQAIVVTDFDVHAMWLVHHYEQYFVAIDEARAYLEALQIPKSKITVTGIPIDPVFAKKKNKVEMRQKHDLDPERITILLSAGGFGVGSVEPLIASLKTIDHPIQVVAICGRNEELRRRLLKSNGHLTTDGNVLIHPVGYTQAMDEYMSASDIVVGKPGGLTTSEGLAKGLAFAIVNPIPGQEERNSDHLLEAGVAIRCNNLPTLPYKLNQLLGDPARLTRMQAASRKLGRPSAATDIAKRVSYLSDEL
jgi:UDP-N-acetylglucosamine:LPS N-acetylglucosamine transferase